MGFSRYCPSSLDFINFSWYGAVAELPRSCRGAVRRPSLADSVEFENMRNIGLFETTRRLNFIKSINKKDFYNLGDLKVLSRYWQKIQTNQELKIEKGFGFLKTHSCLVSIKNNLFTLQQYS